jgi:hypothetical protein
MGAHLQTDGRKVCCVSAARHAACAEGMRSLHALVECVQVASFKPDITVCDSDDVDADNEEDWQFVNVGDNVRVLF